MDKENRRQEFPQKQFEMVLLHSLRVLDQNREYLQMHLAPDWDEKTQQALTDMAQESVRMERTLREMLALLETESGDLPPLKPVELCGILNELERMSPEIRKQLDVELIVDYGGMERCYVQADPEEVEQLLFHLLSNTLRAVSAGGTVAFRLSREEEGLRLTVEDDGCGLPTAENWMENRRRFLGGAQAGLILCRRYCAHMGWMLELNLRTPRGTRAELKLPRTDRQLPIEDLVELRTASGSTEGLHWQLLRELSLLAGRKTDR